MNAATPLTIITLVLLSVNCSHPDDWGNDPADAEVLFVQEDLDPDEYLCFRETDDDQSYYEIIRHKGFPANEQVTLWSPSANLRLILYQPDLGGISGYKIRYNEDGTVQEVTETSDSLLAYFDVNLFELSPSEMMKFLKDWYFNPETDGTNHYFNRDSFGNLESISELEVPYGYQARCFIQPWGNNYYWGSETGGAIQFFVMMESVERTGSCVDLLYAGDHLVAELAYWNDIFIKSLYYTLEGRFSRISSDREIDVFETAFEYSCGDNL